MKLLQVFDDVISVQTQDVIEQILLKRRRFPYHFLNDITTAANYDLDITERTIGFSHVLWHQLDRDKSPFYDTLMHPLYEFCLKQNNYINNVIQARTFLHIPLPQEIYRDRNTPHIDLEFPHLVFLYYVNDSEGDTIFFKDSTCTEVIEQVTPRKGRVALFDGSIYHCSSSPTRNPRSVINVCFNTIDLSS